MKRLILYPFLFALYAILNPLLQNIDQIDPSQALRPLGLALLAAAILMIVLYAIFRDAHYAGYLVFLALLFLFLPGHIYNALQAGVPALKNLNLQAVYVAAALIALVLAWRKVWKRLGGAQRVTPALNYVFVVALASLAVVSAPQIATAARSITPRAQAAVLPSTGTMELDCSNRPDIYYIILDAYGRTDVLDAVYGVDNSDFMEFLESEGFYIGQESHSNFTQTIYSIPSSLNYDFIGVPPDEKSGQKYFRQQVVENRLMDELESCGYQTISFESGFYYTNNLPVDLYLSKGTPLNEFESLLIAGTPLSSVGEKLNVKPPAQSYQAHRDRVLYTLSELKKVPRLPGPKFVFAHILAPHPPFVFDAEGEHIQPNRQYLIADGSDYRGNWKEYQQGYAGQVKFVDERLKETVKAILDNSESEPIIILQGDHGPGGNLDWDSPKTSCLWERSSILNAYHLPGDGEKLLYPSISPVNTFRVILNRYFGADIELAPDKTYFTSRPLPLQQIDITETRDSTANCPLP